jgi:hypothetical protein
MKIVERTELILIRAGITPSRSPPPEAPDDQSDRHSHGTYVDGEHRRRRRWAPING